MSGRSRRPPRADLERAQPYDIVVVSNAELKQRMRPIAYDHSQVVDASQVSASIIAAAFEGVDATPMEGFDGDKLDALLGLRERGLRSVLLLPLGYRAADSDWLVNLKKVRQPTGRFVTELK